ncbi:hypothetical protein ABZ383_32080, partial [Streptomyces sp. NPDC005900]
WSAPDIDGGEPQDERITREDAAIEVCVECPVMMLCHTYANTVDADGHLTEPYGVLGGERALERHKRLVARRHELVAAAPDARFDTPQKQAVLRALAAYTGAGDVAAAAGMDVRTANWQRSHLVTLLGLKRTASRNDLLDAAAARGLLQGVSVTRDDGTVPAIAPPTRPTAAERRARRTARRTTGRPAPRQTPPSTPHRGTAMSRAPVRIRAPRRTRFTAITGQLTLWDTGLAAVHTLPTTPPAHLEAAA